MPLDLPQSLTVTSEVRVGSASMEENAAYLTAVNVPWGKFEPDDLRNLEQSLRNALSRHVPTRSPGPDHGWKFTWWSDGMPLA